MTQSQDEYDYIYTPGAYPYPSQQIRVPKGIDNMRVAAHSGSVVVLSDGKGYRFLTVRVFDLLSKVPSITIMDYWDYAMTQSDLKELVNANITLENPRNVGI